MRCRDWERVVHRDVRVALFAACVREREGRNKTEGSSYKDMECERRKIWSSRNIKRFSERGIVCVCVCVCVFRNE